MEAKKGNLTFIEPVLKSRALIQTFHMLYFTWFSECFHHGMSDYSHFTDEEAPTVNKQWSWPQTYGCMTLKTRHLINSTLYCSHLNLP